MDCHRSSSDSEYEEETLISNNEACPYITDPQEYLEFSLKDKKIKVMDEINPIFNHVFLKDISLHKKGPLEDKIYSRVDNYYKNIRRGNTLCQIYHPDQHHNKDQTYDLFFCRRGMKKFYDLEPDYLKVGASLTTHHQLMRKRIFEGLEEELQRPGAQYHLYCLFKQNGQHCQISYMKELQAWLFASKNVAIVARTPEDLQQHYHKQRFYWAKLIGQQFFNIIEKMTPAKREQFKMDIEGFTLLGEHCGNQKHQHITKYDKVQIIFYGLVHNQGFDHCQPVQQCRSFLDKYGLKMSRCKEKKGLVNKNSILGHMWEMLRAVAEGTMAKEGEGSVMYIVCEREGKERTVGMCKLKTCEYLIYRRLREMLKLNVARKSTANTFQKFKFQIEQLVKHYFKPPQPLEFYYQLGQQAFRECNSNGSINQTYLRYNFVQFITQIQADQSKPTTISSTKPCPQKIILICLPRFSSALEKYCKAKGYDVQYMFRPGKSITTMLVYILYMVPRLPQPLQPNCHIILPQYEETEVAECVKQLEECKDLTKSQLITFIKSQDKAKTVKMLHQKIEAFRQSCQDNNLHFESPSFNDESIIKAIQKNTQTTHTEQKKIHNQNKYLKHFVLPLLIPGSGKSTLAKYIREHKGSNCQWKIIDSDAIRRRVMESEGTVDLNQDKTNKLFIQTGTEASAQFKQQLLTQAQKQPKNLNQCIYLDKIYSPMNIEETIATLLDIQKSYIKIHILIQPFQPIKLNDWVYPYSLNYLLTCLRRSIERTGHPTLPHNPYVVAKVVIKFYQMMANFTPKALLKKFEDKVHFIQLPMIEETEQSSLIHQQLKKKVEQCLSLVEPGHDARESDSFIELVEALYKFREQKQAENHQRYATLRELLQIYMLDKETYQ